jgi:hypothetical protein
VSQKEACPVVGIHNVIDLEIAHFNMTSENVEDCVGHTSTYNIHEEGLHSKDNQLT